MLKIKVLEFFVLRLISEKSFFCTYLNQKHKKNSVLKYGKALEVIKTDNF